MSTKHMQRLICPEPIENTKANWTQKSSGQMDLGVQLSALKKWTVEFAEKPSQEAQRASNEVVALTKIQKDKKNIARITNAVTITLYSKVTM